MSISFGLNPEIRDDSNDQQNTHLNRNLPPLPSTSEAEPGVVPVEKHPTVKVWPEEPQTLHRGGWLSALSCMGDVIVIMTSTMFFVYGSLIIHFDGTPLSEIPQLSILRDASRYGPTIFPILFAAIVGQAMHAIAHWRLENGERMKVLDQLLGSTGLFSAVITQLKFRNIGVVGLALIALWILSPVGGQASLRVLDYGTITNAWPRTMYYLDWNSTYQPGEKSMMGGDASEAMYIADGLFTSALTSTKDVQTSGMDNWGNLKIPMLERLSNLTQDSEGWRDVRQSNVTYSSLIGIPTSAISSDYNTTFNLETPYWSLNCPVLYRYISHNGSRDEWSLPGENISEPLHASDNWVVGLSRSWGISSPDPKPGINEYDKNLTSRVFYYKSFDDDSGASPNGTKADCHMTTSYVEVVASCIGKNCSVTRMRPSTKPHPPPEHALGIDPYTVYFVRDFHGAVNPGSFQLPTAMQRYFVNPYAPFSHTGKDLALYNLSKTHFGDSLAQLMNTFWQASINLAQVTTGVPPVDEIPPSNLYRNLSYIMPRVYNRINATETQTIPVLKCQRPWLAALLMATGAMFLSGMFGLVLEFTRKAPDFALNISSLTRDNPYIHLPAGGSTLDSIDRGRLLQDVRIRLGDVRPNERIGYVAIASCDKEGKVVRLGTLEKGRVYS
ncbi:hypothetical protein K469DRAFT_636229 [Zopfia rhizophila CBS 207.26]|uniref:Uncharacterized protein n=1 Tax=Zopfia rhizophila CBS 207.26 TaxID=1314779 RepID=A0A6A6DXB8_9PEZI|nr:hypothetical protein K469DRAFT_636229 [Zopfia rhizophila CBS 207.26]